MIFVDSNILIDVFDCDPKWAEWSGKQLGDAVGRTALAITLIVVAEVAPRFDSLDAFAVALGAFSITVEPLTDEAAYAAGKAFRAHRRLREGPRSILADFVIGGQAEIAGAAILTRDPAIYARYFPEVSLICPENS